MLILLNISYKIDGNEKRNNDSQNSNKSKVGNLVIPTMQYAESGLRVEHLRYLKYHKMKKSIILLTVLLICTTYGISQVAINTDGSAPDPSAMLDIKSTTKGLLLPRMTNAQIQTIASPANGLLVFSTDDNKVYCFNLGDNEWKGIDYGTGTITPFVCGTSTVNDSDGNTYSTVLIGTQCWLAENLNIGTRIDGNNSQTNNGIIEKYCYNDEDANCITYGGLYQWDEMMQFTTTEGSQGICPSGWHIPTDNEWKQLEITLGMSQSEADNTGWRGTNEGGKLKETGTSHWNTPNTGATNESGLTALPGGSVFIGFGGLGELNSWGSSSGTSPTYKWYRYLSYDSEQVYRASYSKNVGRSVRCLIQL